MPDYKVYRARPGIFARLGSPGRPSLPSPRPSLRLPGHSGGGRRRWLRWALRGVLAWILLSLVLFTVSSELQKSKLPASAYDALHGGPDLITGGQNILVIGTDVRPRGSKEAGAQTIGSPSCPNVARCANTRADSLMVIRAGGGVFRKLSIPRDSFAQIPGYSAQKINAAYAYGGPALEIRTVESFLGLPIDHVVIVDFDGFQALIDALGGVEVHLRTRICARINGGSSNGGVTLRLRSGAHTLDGRHALAVARARESTCSSLSDLDRAANQQRILTGIRDRLTSLLRLPYNFIKAPMIAWDAPRTMVSDMGAATLPQLVIDSAVGGNENPRVLKPSGPGPAGSLLISQDERRREARRLAR